MHETSPRAASTYGGRPARRSTVRQYANTRRARAVRELQRDWRFALTGTPLENQLGELWSLFRVVTPGLLGSWEQFRDR